MLLLAGMCSTYVARPLKGAAGWKARVSDDIGKLKSALIRKSDPGVVVLAAGQDFTAETMRWGFHRPFNPSINNSRSDKLETGMWKDALRERRCLVPASSYYEWGPAIGGGKKPAYEIAGESSDWLWIAGLWEKNPDLGRCYSMITTGPAPSVAHIHDRMPAILPWESAQEFLAKGYIPFSPHLGPLVVSPCQSPLIQKPPGPEQGFLC